MKRSAVFLFLLAAVLLAARPVFAAKDGAQLADSDAMIYARGVIARIWQRFGYLLTVTSGYEGTHAQMSKHYAGLAEDYRTRDVDGVDLVRMVAEVRSTLGRNYDVVIESDHLHVEYDPT